MPTALIQAPHIQILKAARAATGGADFASCGLPVGAVVKARHARNRKPVRGERPAVTLIMVTDEPTPVDLNLNQNEYQRRLTIDLQADVELDTELSGDDETALEVLSAMLLTAVDAIRAGLVDVVCDWIELGAYDPEDRATPDDGRLVLEMIVVYRVRQDDEKVLLAPGAD
jgi:hypothetical protein